MSLTRFTEAMTAAGLSGAKELIADGQIHRFHVVGDRPGSRNGWYVLYDEPLLAGAFGSWKTGEQISWSETSSQHMSPRERQEHHNRIAAVKAERRQAEQARQRQAQQKAARIWQQAQPAPHNHPYLLKKGIKSHGLRVARDALIVPLRDVERTLWSLQFIDGAGDKRFLSGGRIRGCYYALGATTETLCIVEGYATGASVHEATGYGVAVALNAGNLMPVAKALRGKFPDARLILCADNDTQTDGNPGVSKAKAAALATNATLAIAGGVA